MGVYMVCFTFLTKIMTLQKLDYWLQERSLKSGWNFHCTDLLRWQYYYYKKISSNKFLAKHFYFYLFFSGNLFEYFSLRREWNMTLFWMDIIWTRKVMLYCVVTTAFFMFTIISYVRFKLFSCMQPKAMPTVNSLEDYLGVMKSMREWRTQFGNEYLGISGIWEAWTPTPKAVRSQSHHMNRMETHIFFVCFLLVILLKIVVFSPSFTVQFLKKELLKFLV